MLYELARPFLFALSGEQSHDLTLAMLRRGAGRLWPVCVPSKPVRVMGIDFPNPVGLAAGLDKNGDCIRGLAALGFGFLEIGTVTPRPQPGNPKPRLFRLPPAKALINRMGFNNQGLDYLMRSVEQSRYDGVLGINIGKNFDTPVERAVDDYLLCLQRVHQAATYVVVNISSPNTPGLRDLQHEYHVKQVLQAAFKGRDEAIGQPDRRPPVFVKLAPDMQEADLLRAMDASLETGINGFILTNTTMARPEGLQSRHRDEAGGLSGQPLTRRALDVLAMASAHLQRLKAKDIVLIGAGGIGRAEQAYARLLVGADLLQLYTALALQGPYIVGQILRQLKAMMIADGLDQVNQITQKRLSADQAILYAAHISKIVSKS